MFHPASPLSLVGFLAVCFFVLASFLRGIWWSARIVRRNPGTRTSAVAGGLVVWLGLLTFLVASGWVAAAPWHLLMFGGLSLLGSAIVGLSPMGRWLAVIPAIPWLLAFQGFRFPLEIVLHSWVKQGVIPQTMTWTRSNWDVAAGVIALVLAPLSGRSRVTAWSGNVIGFVLLLNVGRVAVFSAPVPFGWADVSPKLELPFYLPYAFIVPICVGGALAGHVILTRALLLRRS